MTGTFIQPRAIKDILIGIFYSMLIIIVMYTMPVIGVFAWILLPLPVLFYRLKIGRNYSSIIMAVSMTVLIGLTSNFAFNALYFGSLLMTGFLLGECIEKHLSIEKTMAYTCLGLFAALMVFLMIYAVTQSQGIEQLISNYISRYQTLSAQLFSESTQLYPDVALDRQLFERASSLFMIAFPGIIITTYLTMTLINILFIKRLLKKNDITIQSLENLNQWRAPEKLVLGLICISLLLLLPVGVLKILFLNCLIILMSVYFFQGIAVVSYFFQKKGVPFSIKSFFYILIAIQPLFMLLVIGCGLFDTWINFRRLDTTIEQK